MPLIARAYRVSRGAGGYAGFVEKVEYISRLKELVAGERASIEAIKREMEQEQAGQ